MKISKQLSKILIFTFFILIIQSAKAQEIKEIWSEIEKKEISENESVNNEDSKSVVNELEGVEVKFSDENI